MRILAALLFALVASHAHATDYYVDDGGAGAVCTFVSPCPEFELAFALAVGGDTIYVRAGTYTEPIDVFNFTITGGTSEATRLTLQNYNGESVIVQPIGSVHALRFAAGADYITVRGITFDGANQAAGAIDSVVKITYSGTAGPVTAATNIILDGVEVGNTLNNCILITGENGTGAYVTPTIIRNSHIHDCGTTTLRHGVYASADAVSLIGNTIHGGGGYGVIFYNSTGGIDGGLARDNRIYDFPNRAGILLGADGVNEAYDNVLYNMVNGVVVYADLGETATGNIGTRNCMFALTGPQSAEEGPGTIVGSVLDPNHCPNLMGGTARGVTIR